MTESTNPRAQDPPRPTRFPILANRWFFFANLLLGTTRRRRYLELTPEGLVARFGWVLHHTFPLASMAGANYVYDAGPGWGRDDRPGQTIGFSYGVTLYRKGIVNLTFSNEGLVGIWFEPRALVRVLVKRVWIERLTASLEDPEQFLDALEERGVTTR